MMVLLIDDDRDDCEIFHEALTELNPNVSCLFAYDCESALQLLAHELLSLPDVIFLDINMPVMNGKACLEEIRKRSRLEKIPVIVYSTTICEEDRKQVGAYGATCLVKPCTYTELKSKIATVLIGLSAMNYRAGFTD